MKLKRKKKNEKRNGISVQFMLLPAQRNNSKDNPSEDQEFQQFDWNSVIEKDP